MNWGGGASLQFVRLRYSWVWTGERNLVHMLIPLPHWVVEALQVLRCLRSGFNYKGIFIDLNCLKFLWYPLHQSKQEIKFQTKAVIGQFQCFIMLTDWLMLNKKTSSHLHSFKIVRPQWQALTVLITMAAQHTGGGRGWTHWDFTKLTFLVLVSCVFMTGVSVTQVKLDLDSSKFRWYSICH